MWQWVEDSLLGGDFSAVKDNPAAAAVFLNLR